MNILDPDALSLTRRKDGILSLSGEGYTDEPIKVRILFPLSDPRNHIQLNTVDGDEIGVIESLEALPPTISKIIDEEIERTFFVTKITKILELEAHMGIMTWTVETNRGPKTFRIPDRDHVRYLSGTKILFKDDNEDRYLLEDRRKLDRHSRELLEPEL